MTDSEQVEHAMVLTGGGAHCAFQAGVFSALAKEPCCPDAPTGYLNPRIVSGSSFGALNAALLMSKLDNGPQAAADLLEHVWRDRIPRKPNDCSNGIFRIRFDASPYFDPRCLLHHPVQPLIDIGGDFAFFAYDLVRRAGNFVTSGGTWQTRMLELPDISDYICTSPLRRLLRETIDLSRIKNSERKFLITATDWKRGRAELFDNHDMTEQHGYNAILASAALPGMLAPINIGPELFVDGSTAMNTPLIPAINARRRSTRHLAVHVIYVDPLLDEIPFPDLPGALSNFYRFTVLFLSRTLTTDIEALRRFSLKLKASEDDDRGKPEFTEEARQMLQVFDQPPEHGLRITIHRYRPPQPLGGLAGLLDFRRAKITRLIEVGKQTGRSHDCTTAGCETVEFPAPSPTSQRTLR